MHKYKTGGEVGNRMSNVIVKENESLDSALRRFKRNCAKAGIQQEIRKREHYEKPSVRRKKSLKRLVRENLNNFYLIEKISIIYLGTGIWCFFSAYIKPNATKGVLHEEETKRSDC